jgi:hypothetical protein
MPVRAITKPHVGYTNATLLLLIFGRTKARQSNTETSIDLRRFSTTGGIPFFSYRSVSKCKCLNESLGGDKENENEETEAERERDREKAIYHSDIDMRRQHII